MNKLAIIAFALVILAGCDKPVTPTVSQQTTLQKIQEHAWFVRIDYYKGLESKPDSYTVTAKFDSPENLLGSTTITVEETAYDAALTKALDEIKAKL